MHFCFFSHENPVEPTYRFSSFSLVPLPLYSSWLRSDPSSTNASSSRIGRATLKQTSQPMSAKARGGGDGGVEVLDDEEKKKNLALGPGPWPWKFPRVPILS